VVIFGVVSEGEIINTTPPVPVAAEVDPVPPFAAGRVPVTCEVKLTPVNVPPNVMLPVDVTVPLSEIPLTVPVPLTEVTPPSLLGLALNTAAPAPAPSVTTITLEPLGIFTVAPDPCLMVII